MIPLLAPLVGAPKEGPSIAGYHKIVDYLRCPQEYKFKHVMGLKQKNKQDTMALLVGVLTHAGRAAWFASQFKGTIDEAHEAITACAQSTGTKERVDAEREAKRLVAAYIEHWRSKPLPLCVAVEYEVGPAPLKVGSLLHQYRTARYDDVSRYPDALNKLCIGDLKTTSDTIASCVNEYRQNGQFILYSILWKMAKEGHALFGATHGPIAGIMVDIETKEAVPKFHRELIVVTPFQEHWFIKSMEAWLNEASLITETTEVRRNVTACSRAVSRKGSYMCDYHQLCHFGGSAANQYVDKNGSPPKKDVVEL